MVLRLVFHTFHRVFNIVEKAPVEMWKTLFIKSSVKLVFSAVFLPNHKKKIRLIQKEPRLQREEGLEAATAFFSILDKISVCEKAKLF